MANRLPDEPVRSDCQRCYGVLAATLKHAQGNKGRELIGGVGDAVRQMRWHVVVMSCQREKVLTHWPNRTVPA